MRNLCFSFFPAVIGLIILSVTPFAYAADDNFGNPFSNQTPGAFDDPDPESLAARLNSDSDMGDVDPASLNAIMTAAGDEARQDNLSEQAAEDVLTDEYGTDVTRTVIDRGDGETATRDRMGEGEIGVFYDHKRDERIMDSDDAIGVEIKLHEFK